MRSHVRLTFEHHGDKALQDYRKIDYPQHIFTIYTGLSNTHLKDIVKEKAKVVMITYRALMIWGKAIEFKVSLQ